MSFIQRSCNLSPAAAVLAVLSVVTTAALANDGVLASSVGADHVGGDDLSTAARDDGEEHEGIIERELVVRRERHAQLISRHREEHTQLAQRADRVRRELEELGDRHLEERRALENALHATESRAHDVARRARDVERDAAQSRLRTLQREVERLADVGRYDEAERVGQKVRQLARGLETETRRQERAHGPERIEFERRAGHLRIAIENLHAAGLRDQAEHLERAAERLLQPEPASQERHVQQERQRGPALEEAVDRLHAQVAEMREAMHGLQEQIDRLSQQRRREER